MVCIDLKCKYEFLFHFYFKINFILLYTYLAQKPNELSITLSTLKNVNHLYFYYVHYAKYIEISLNSGDES